MTVVTSDLLKDHDAAEPAEPEVAATAPAESEPQRFQNDDLILDELDNYPSRPVLDGKSARPLAARDANPAATKDQGVEQDHRLKVAGSGLIDRLLSSGKGDSVRGSHVPSMSSADSIAGVEQIRDDLDFDTIFDDDAKEMAKLTSQELAELEKARFGPNTGEVPEWGLPGPGGKGVSRLFPSTMYTVDDAAGREGFRRRSMGRSADGCRLCVSEVDTLDWKNVQLLNEFVGDFGKVQNRRTTGMCGRHQRMVAQAIKRARHMAFMPFVGRLSKSSR